MRYFVAHSLLTLPRLGAIIKGMSMAHIDTEKMYTTREAAEMLGLTPETIKRYCHKGRIAAVPMRVNQDEHGTANRWFITKQAIEDYQKSRRPYNK